MSRIEIYDTTLRDSAHTLRKSPLRVDEILPLAEMLDAVGFSALEVWGGATFDVCLRYLDEDPWERLRMLHQKFRSSPLRILLRGQNLLGYRPMPLDVIRAFAAQVAESGIRLARIFDALNDIDNLEVVVQALKEVEIEVEGALIYTQSPVHSVERFVADAERLAALGCRSVCITDIAGMITPTVARELVKLIGRRLPVTIHARATTGMAAMSYMAAIESGATGIDCTIAPFGIASTLPSVEAMLESLVGTAWQSPIDRKALKAASRRAESIAVQHAMHQADRQIVESAVSVHKISIGMLSGLTAELRTLNAQHRLNEVLAEVTRVREDFGWPPLITPISQMVSAQAIQNIILGKRYSIMSREVKEYLKGMYGHPPGEVNPELMKDIAPVSGRAALLLPPVMEKAEAELRAEGLRLKSEDVLTYALAGQVGAAYLRHRKDPQSARPAARTPGSKLQLLTAFMDRRGLGKLELTGPDFRVRLVKRRAQMVPAIMGTAVADAADGAATPESTAAPVVQGTPIPAPLSGIFYRSPSPGQPAFVEPGSPVSEGAVVGLIEAMKLFHEVKATGEGTLRAFAIENGASVEQGEAVAFIADSSSS